MNRLKTFTRWIVRKLGIEAEIKKETKAEIGNQIEELRAWITTAEGTLILKDNPEIGSILTEIELAFKLNYPHMPYDDIRKRTLLAIKGRSELRIKINLILEKEEVSKEDFFKFIDQCKLYINLLSEDNFIEAPNKTSQETVIDRIIEMRDWDVKIPEYFIGKN